MDEDVTYDNARARQLRKRANAFSIQPKFFAALNGLSLDSKRLAAAISDPEAFLRKTRLRLPDGLGFELFSKPPRFLPFPDWTPWIIELTLCRSHLVFECDSVFSPSGIKKCEPKEVEVCLGFRIYPRPWPRGPYSL